MWIVSYIESPEQWRKQSMPPQKSHCLDGWGFSWPLSWICVKTNSQKNKVKKKSCLKPTRNKEASKSRVSLSWELLLLLVAFQRWSLIFNLLAVKEILNCSEIKSWSKRSESEASHPGGQVLHKHILYACLSNQPIGEYCIWNQETKRKLGR